MKRLFQLLVVFLVASAGAQPQTLRTKWAASVTPENVHREYPRPQLVRQRWTNLNGLWDFAITKSDQAPGGYSEKILVPFPVESQLSRITRRVEPGDVMWYRRSFKRPAGAHVLLHVGASDWETRVWVNGKDVGRHRGGYDRFTFDITNALTPGGEQGLLVSVQDPTDAGPQPRGKQVLKPEGIWYTPTSGIWQTVWLEGVPSTYIEGLKVDPSSKTGRVSVAVRTAGRGSRISANVEVIFKGVVQASVREPLERDESLRGGREALPKPLSLHIPTPNLWSPSNPALYDLRTKLLDEKGKVVDQVTSYFAFRDVSLVRDQSGQLRFALNGKPYFMIGPLDQGFWPDGIYTAPSDAALRYDLEVTKRLGFNMIRKHVKVEPDRWYYWCDRLGIIVLQDMPSGDKYIGGSDPDIERTPESERAFREELKAMVDNLRAHPCIAAWVLFNEGWGQWKTAEMTKWLKSYDPSRVVDSVTGWTDRGVGDFRDIHAYPGPASPPSEPRRALLLGEFGGLGLPTPGHMWRETGWGYQSFKTKEELTNRFVELFQDLRYLIDTPGLSGAVYTQTTDVETELNGLMTYDRAVFKMDEGKVRKAIKALYEPPPIIEQVVPTSESAGQSWKYTTIRPPDGWEQPMFQQPWTTGLGGFGTPETPGSIVRTRWDTQDIWLRRRFFMNRSDAALGNLYLRVSYDDDVEVFIDGKPVYKASGWTTNYRNIPLKPLFAMDREPGSRGWGNSGEHTLAIHCRQNSGGQYVDAGIVRIRPGG